MIQKLSNITVVVKDQAKALDFYTQVLGLEKRTDVPAPPGGSRWVTVAPKGQDIEISIFQAGSFPVPNAPENQWKPGGNPGWTFQTDDCRGDYSRLKDKGVVFDMEPADNPWSTVASFRDPDGNAFRLVQFKRR